MFRNGIKKIIKSGLLVCLGFLFSFQEGSFKAVQLKYSRVKTAYEKKWPVLKALLTSKNLQTDKFDLYLRAFKQDGLLEVWAKNKTDKQYQLLKTFPVCATSGALGPKRKQGDGQVPEGFYEIAAFQPHSNYHLALKVGYPNKSDRLKATGSDPGGDIMIHGNCVTIGCIPIQNEPIEELYVLCVEAKNRNSILYTDIYPFKFNEKNTTAINLNQNSETVLLWNSLKKAYDHFELNHTLPKITTDTKGNYTVVAI
jgi:murein L,D-transpeptidase YafK